MKNLSGAIGYLLVFLFLYLAIAKSTNNPELFLNIHGIGIVCGGLVVAALASFPLTLLKDAFRSVYRSLNSNGEIQPSVAESVVEVGTAYQKGLSELEIESAKVQHGFLSQAVNLILEGIKPDTLLEILDRRIDEKRDSVQNQMNVMLTLSKYSPALGLAATVLGLVDLLGSLQEADMAKLGFGMAIALSATFYGIILSNLVFAPLSEMIGTLGETEAKELEMIKDGIHSTLEKKHGLVIGEVVNSYLSEPHRVNFVEKLQSGRNAA